MPKIIADVDIFHAVMKVVSERGYAGATTREMAQTANVSEVTLFRRYGSKLELVKQAISAIVEESGFSEAVYHSGDLDSDLLRVVEAYKRSALRHGVFLSALLSDISRHPELSTSLAGPLEVFRSVAELIACYQSDGKLIEEEPYHAVAALFGPMIFGNLMASAIPGDFYPPLDLQKHLAAFLSGRKV